MLTLGGVMCLGMVPIAAQEKVWPLRWGVDDAGGPAHLDRHPRATALFEEFGFNLWVMHYLCEKAFADNVAYIRRVDAWCARQGIDWIANLEHANWIAQHVDDRDRDWFNRPDGRHFFLFPEDLLQELSRCQCLAGLMYDEAAHMQNCRNKIAGLDQPFIFDPTGHSLPEAADAFTEAARQVANQHRAYGLKLYTEHVFPVLYHGFARAGFVAGTKILKENWSPAFIASAMGAALEYDTELWITPDLWGIPGYPGHSAEEYRSALLLAYHLGADCIYTENLAFDNENKGKGSLVLMNDQDYTVTEYGQVTKWFWREYVPAHPRTYSFRQVKPRVAIVRQEDACWGQRHSWLPDWLFGCKEWHSDETTEAWLKIWHLLSRGVIPPDALSWHAASLSTRPYQVFCPLNGVVEFDHHVEEKYLQGVKVIFLTGYGVSPATQEAVARCVAAGATCVGLPPLLPQRVRAATGEEGILSDGQGLWVATRDFLSPVVRDHVAHVLPAEDEIRYQFGEIQVVFHPREGDPNRLEVRVEKLGSE